MDNLSRDILSQHIDTIIRVYPHKLCEIIHGVLRIQLTNIDCAIRFIRNNPRFYDRIVNDVRDLYFDFTASPLREKNGWRCQSNLINNLFIFNSKSYINTPRVAVLELIINAINFVLFPRHDNEYIEFGINDNAIDDHNNCRKSSSGEDSLSTKSNLASGLDLFDMSFYRADFLQNIKKHHSLFDKYWEECSEDDKLAIAKYCLSHHIVAVNHTTTVNFMKLLIKNQEQSNWLADFAANMKKHKASQQERNLLLEKHYGPESCDNTVIDDSLPL